MKKPYKKKTFSFCNFSLSSSLFFFSKGKRGWGKLPPSIEGGKRQRGIRSIMPNFKCVCTFLFFFFSFLFRFFFFFGVDFFGADLRYELMIMFGHFRLMASEEGLTKCLYFLFLSLSFSLLFLFFFLFFSFSLISWKQ